MCSLIVSLRRGRFIYIILVTIIIIIIIDCVAAFDYYDEKPKRLTAQIKTLNLLPFSRENNAWTGRKPIDPYNYNNILNYTWKLNRAIVQNCRANCVLYYKVYIILCICIGNALKPEINILPLVCIDVQLCTDILYIYSTGNRLNWCFIILICNFNPRWSKWNSQLYQCGMSVWPM